MTTFLELDDVKLHCSIELEDTSEDTYLTGLIAAAQGAVEIRTARWIDPANKPAGSAAADFTPGELDMARHAARLLIAGWYLNREAQMAAGAAAELPIGVKFLLEPLRDFSAR